MLNSCDHLLFFVLFESFFTITSSIVSTNNMQQLFRNVHSPYSPVKHGGSLPFLHSTLTLRVWNESEVLNCGISGIAMSLQFLMLVPQHCVVREVTKEPKSQGLQVNSHTAADVIYKRKRDRNPKSKVSEADSKVWSFRTLETFHL